MIGDKVLVIGSGSREHCIAWKIAQDEQVSMVYVCPGNGGTSDHKISPIVIPLNKSESYKQICKYVEDNNISLVIVGPEEPLCNGIADILKSRDIPCFGPCEAAARLEGSKIYSKQFMRRHNIPTPNFEIFSGQEMFDRAVSYLKSTWNESKCVIKASGLAAGKGVVVADSLEESIKAIEENLIENKYGDASKEIIIEERIFGKEVSLFILSNGEDFIALPPCHDYKRLNNNDKGPNTGGMGAVCPSPRISKETYDEAIEKIVKVTLSGLRSEHTPFVGCLYVGLMLTSTGPKCLEYNVRFGDPETQALLASISDNFYSTLLNCAIGAPLNPLTLQHHTVSIVLASEGYPDKPVKGKRLKGIEQLKLPPYTFLFHGGTSKEGSEYFTSGGRVLTLMARQSSLEKARELAYSTLPEIAWEGCQYRIDIGEN